ncbi:MAG: hypothetical protein WC441_03220 [Patescibacteria group bacterium]
MDRKAEDYVEFMAGSKSSNPLRKTGEQILPPDTEETNRDDKENNDEIPGEEDR